ncbi:dipeptidase PepE [Lutimonas saemankumensis]|uniref:dipeptidase PepE n=1 Tax=Lutimonas saemankumensis TaxID=483016 RepID=UPI001CD239D3|nr:dipeptidase PepE [Lutimonas saemankumensis]MCA0931100.1 dipeptidase PepE [Lutimonas saemankumensis]
MKNLIVASTSTIHGSSFLEYLLPELKDHFKQIKTLLFIPFARPGGISHDAYTDQVRKGLKSLPIEVKGLHEFKDQVEAVESAEGIFTGGGNTFVLLDQLQQKKLIEPLERAINKGVPYLGTSAGSNIIGPTVNTTNDMPIVHPESLDALGAIPFNINPHYLDPDPDSTHKGETRETRIKEFHCFNESTVIGLREGSWISVKGAQIKLKGTLSARVFIKNKEAFEVQPGYIFNQLL